MATEFELTSQKILNARFPEEIFGDLEDTEDKIKAGRSIYRRLSRATHPNFYKGDEEVLAETTLEKLRELWELAQIKIKEGTYGNIPKEILEAIIVKGTDREYRVLNQIAESDFTRLLRCVYLEKGVEKNGIFKVVNNASDNDMLENEASILNKLYNAKGYEKYFAYIPELLDCLTFNDKNDLSLKRANIFPYDKNLYNLEEIKNYYPDGVDPKDMAWIFRRILVGAGFINNSGIMYGAALPPNILIHPEKHGVILTEFSYGGEKMMALDSRYEPWYPREVFRKEDLSPALDIYMASQCMVYILGGDPLTGKLPESVDKRFEMFFRGCMLPAAINRPRDAWNLLGEFDELIEDIWGPKKFHPFTMPPKSLQIKT